MWKCRRVSRSTLYSFCLVTGTFWACLLLLYVLDRQTTRSGDTSRMAVRSGETEPGVKVNGQGSERSKLRPWWLHPEVGPGMTFATSPYNADNKRALTASPTQSEGSNPKIIAWQALRTLRILAASSDMFQNCPVKDCRVSPSSKALPAAAAIVYDDGRMNKQTPPQLKVNRVVVYYSMRTPSEVFFKAKGDLFGRYWTSAVTWTWSYRLDSDIFQPFGYLASSSQHGKLTTITNSARKKSKMALWINPRVNRKEDGLEDIDINLHKTKSQTGVEEYLKEFRKEVGFDTIGMMDLQAALSPNSTKAKRGFTITKYHFILAFEWVACRDYVTDVVWDAFDPRVQAVPVVRGSFNYTRHLPPDTYINADHFAGPRELARYLRDLASDTKAYSRLLWKKSQYRKEDALPHAWCQLCDMLHRVTTDVTLTRRYDDIHAWYEKGGHCVTSNTTE